MATATDTTVAPAAQRDFPPQGASSRRALLGALAAAGTGLAGGLPVAAAPSAALPPALDAHRDAALFTAFADFAAKAKRAWPGKPDGLTDDERAPYVDEAFAAQDAVMALQPQTMDGLLLQLRVYAAGCIAGIGMLEALFAGEPFREEDFQVEASGRELWCLLRGAERLARRAER